MRVLLLLNSACSFNTQLKAFSIYTHNYFEDQLISKLLQLKLCNVGFLGGRGSAVKE